MLMPSIPTATGARPRSGHPADRPGQLLADRGEKVRAAAPEVEVVAGEDPQAEPAVGDVSPAKHLVDVDRRVVRTEHRRDPNGEGRATGGRVRLADLEVGSQAWQEGVDQITVSRQPGGNAVEQVQVLEEL